MKIRNLAFCGVMASILSGWGALAADGDTIIASKAYVDAMDATKQDKNDRVTETWANSTTDHNSQTKYPSMYTLNSAVGAGTSALDGNNADSETGVSAGAAADNTKIGMPVVKVTETDGIVTATLGTITDKGLAANAVTEAKINNGAVTENKIGTGAVTTDKIADGNVTMPKTDFIAHESLGNGEGQTTDVSWLAADPNSENEAEKLLAEQAVTPEGYVPTMGAVEGLLLKQGQSAKSWTEDGDDNTAEAYNYDRAASYDANGEFVAAGMTDNYVPTVAAVEKRVQKAQADAISAAGTNAGNLKDTAASATWANNTLTIVTGDNPGNKTDKLATSAQVNTSVSALKSYTDDKITTLDNASEATDSNNTYHTPIVAVSEADGIVTATRGTISYQDAMENALKDVNNKANNQTCNAANPCVLTYIGTQASGVPEFRWTQMDTEGVNAGV